MKLMICCLAIFSLTTIAARAQQKVIADFEQANPEASWGWDEQPGTVTNPDKGGVNTSSQVLQWKKSAGSWKGFTVSFDGADLSKNPVVSFQLYSPVKGTVSGRMETGTASETIFFNVDITETNKWVNYTTDLTSLLKTVKIFKLASFFINPEKGDDTSIYYWDSFTVAPKK